MRLLWRVVLYAIAARQRLTLRAACARHGTHNSRLVSSRAKNSSRQGSEKKLTLEVYLSLIALTRQYAA